MAEDKASAEKPDNAESPDDKRKEVRRKGPDDRRINVVEQRVGLNRRRGPGRRRSESRKAAEEGEMTDEQFDFLMAINRYKSVNNRPFPTWTEVLDVIHAIGYRKVAEPQDIE